MSGQFFPSRRRHLFSFFFAILSPSIAARRESAMGSERRRRRRRRGRGRKEALRHRAFCRCCLSLPSAQIPPGALFSAAAVTPISPSARFSRRDFPMRHFVQQNSSSNKRQQQLSSSSPSAAAHLFGRAHEKWPSPLAHCACPTYKNRPWQLGPSLSPPIIVLVQVAAFFCHASGLFFWSSSFSIAVGANESSKKV